VNFAPLALSHAFAPTLGRNGGGAIINILSALSWISLPSTGTYSASKAAAWALTNTCAANCARKTRKCWRPHGLWTPT
jgi:short-subunit dehydrogenase